MDRKYQNFFTIKPTIYGSIVGLKIFKAVPHLCGIFSFFLSHSYALCYAYFALFYSYPHLFAAAYP